MKISSTLSDLRPAKERRLPGEPHPFKERSGLRNLVPPQHLEPDGTVVSGRSHEVSKADPLMLRIRELEAECEALRQQLEDRK